MRLINILDCLCFLVSMVSNVRAQSFAIGDHDGSIRIFNENKSLTHQFKAHDKVVRRLKFNPYTSLLASCSSDSYVKIWHTNNYTEPLYTFKHDGEVYTMDFIDNNTIATGSLDKTVKIWSLSSGNLINKINVEYSVSCIKMLPNGLLAVASESNLIRIFNYTNSNLTKTLNGHKNIVTNLELIVGNKFVYLASAGIDTTILIWDLNDNYKCIRNMTYSSDESYSHYLKFIENSNLLVSSSSNKTVNIWEMPSGKLIKTIDDFTWHVLRSIDFVPDNSNNNSEDRGGGTLLISGLDGKVIFWNVSSGIITRTYNMSFGFGIFSLAALDTTHFELLSQKKGTKRVRHRSSSVYTSEFTTVFSSTKTPLIILNSTIASITTNLSTSTMILTSISSRTSSTTILTSISSENQTVTATETSAEASTEFLVETSTEISAETSASTETESSAETSIETSVETSNETSSESLAESSAETLTLDTTSTETSTETLTETSAEISTEVSAQIPTEISTDILAHSSDQSSTDITTETSTVTSTSTTTSTSTYSEILTQTEISTSTLITSISISTTSKSQIESSQTISIKNSLFFLIPLILAFICCNIFLIKSDKRVENLKISNATDFTNALNSSLKTA